MPRRGISADRLARGQVHDADGLWAEAGDLPAIGSPGGPGKLPAVGLRVAPVGIRDDQIEGAVGIVVHRFGPRDAVVEQPRSVRREASAGFVELASVGDGAAVRPIRTGHEKVPIPDVSPGAEHEPAAVVEFAGKLGGSILGCGAGGALGWGAASDSAGGLAEVHDLVLSPERLPSRREQSAPVRPWPRDEGAHLGALALDDRAVLEPHQCHRRAGAARVAVFGHVAREEHIPAVRGHIATIAMAALFGIDQAARTAIGRRAPELGPAVAVVAFLARRTP